MTRIIDKDGVPADAEGVAQCPDCSGYGHDGDLGIEGAPEGETCETCQGNGEVVTDWDRYLGPALLAPGEKADG